MAGDGPRKLASDDPLAQELLTALRRGDAGHLAGLLERDPGLARCLIDSVPPLHHFADAPGHRPNPGPVVAVLARAGANVDAQATGTWHEETALHWAASNDDVELIDALLDAGADLEHPGSSINGGPPLQSATGYAQWRAARRLVERGARMNIFVAAALGLLPELRQFLATAEPDEVNCALWNACRGGQQDAVGLLLEHGADLNWPAPWSGETPLDAARSGHQEELAGWLAGRGAVSGSPPSAAPQAARKLKRRLDYAEAARNTQAHA